MTQQLQLPMPVTIGATMTGVRIPHRLYRGKPRIATGRLISVFPDALRVSNEDGCFLIERDGAREVA